MIIYKNIKEKKGVKKIFIESRKIRIIKRNIGKILIKKRENQ